MRRAARKDLLHVGVGKVFQEAGWSALDLSRLGDGYPDWLFVRRGFPLLVEVKTEGWRNHIKQGTAERQQEFAEGWTACLLERIESLEQAWKLAEALGAAP